MGIFESTFDKLTLIHLSAYIYPTNRYPTIDDIQGSFIDSDA